MVTTEYLLKPMYAQLLSDEAPDPDAVDLDDEDDGDDDDDDMDSDSVEE